MTYSYGLTLKSLGNGGSARVANRPVEKIAMASHDTWEAVAENVESAITVMEDVAQYVGLRSRNKIWYSLNRCYKRAKYIRGIRGIEQLEDDSDMEHFVQPKCMLGRFIGGEF